MTREGSLPKSDTVARLLERLSPLLAQLQIDPRFPEWVARTADPAAALIHFEALLAAGWQPKPDSLEALLRVCGASQALTTVLLSVPGATPEWFDQALRIECVFPSEHVAEIERAAGGSFDSHELPILLRRHKRRHVLRIGARDLAGVASVEDTVRELSALAEGAIEAATRFARAQVAKDYGTSSDRLRFVVLGMGKLGGGELNFSSDIDLIYLFDGGNGASSGGARGAIGAPAYATRIAELATRTLSEVSGEGFVFRVDLRLRPDGQNGPIVNSLGGTLTYYESWGQTWERAAMLKARPVGGDIELGREFLDEMRPFIYRRYLDFTTIEEIEEMKRKVDSAQSHARLDRDVKLGRGGIREVEFVVQALQLVHAGRDERLRKRSTLATLDSLADLGLMATDEAATLAEAYRFLRDVEHKIQIVHERQSQLVPADPEEERLLARRLGYHLRAAEPGGTGAAEVDRTPREVSVFRQELERHRGAVRRYFAKLFSGDKTEIRAEAEEAATALLQSLEEGQAAEARLAAMGFRDPKAAVKNLLLLRDGPSFSRSSPKRRRALFALAPALLSAIRKASDPDQALRQMAEFISAIGARTSFLALLEQKPETLRLLVGLFGSSEYLSNFFLRHPELLDSLVRADLAVVRKERAMLEKEIASHLAAATDYETELDTLRSFRNEELLRIGVNDIHGLLATPEVGDELSTLAEVCLEAALAIAVKGLAERYGPPPGRFAVFALGKLGRSGLTYNSDLDLIFVYDRTSEPSAPLSVHEYFAKLAQRLIVVLQLTTREGYVYKIDTRLRPSGTHGPLVSSLDGFREYHRTSSAVWERQALIAARGVAGERSLIEETESVIEGFVYGRGLTSQEVTEIARLRARMERELARESEERWNLKVGRGGIVDIEFVVEMLQLRHGWDHPRVRRRGTDEALDRLVEEKLLAPAHHSDLTEGYRFLRRVESRLRIERDQAVEALDRTDPKLPVLARRLGYGGDPEAAARRLLLEIASTRETIRRIYEEYFGI